MVPLPRAYWHTIPLHFLPTLLAEGQLRASAYPRPRVAARRRKLGLSGYLHLSFTPSTPLLTDKRAKGYPHALLAFPPSVATLPGAAYCRYNQTAWRHRDDFAPVTTEQEKATFLAAWQAGQYPSAELLIPEQLALTHASALYLASEEEKGWLAVFALPTPPTLVSPETFPPMPVVDVTPFWEYARACQQAGAILPPPPLRFD